MPEFIYPIPIALNLQIYVYNKAVNVPIIVKFQFKSYAMNNELMLS